MCVCFYRLQCLTMTFSPLGMNFIKSFYMSLSQTPPLCPIEGSWCRKPLITLHWIELDHPVKLFMLRTRTLISSRLSTQCHPVSVRTETQIQVFWLPSLLKFHTLSYYLGCEQRWDPVTKRCGGVCLAFYSYFLILFYFIFCLFVLFCLFLLNKENKGRGCTYGLSGC